MPRLWYRMDPVRNRAGGQMSLASRHRLASWPRAGLVLALMVASGDSAGSAAPATKPAKPAHQATTDHGRDHHVRLAKGAALRDSFGNPLYEGAKTNVVTLGGGTYTIQRQPIVKDLAGHLMYYVWGNRGSFLLAGGKAPVNYSG